MGLWMNLNVGAVALTTITLTALIVVYIGNVRQAPSAFTWGLMLFAVALWFQAAVQLYFFATMMPLYTAGVDKLILVQNLLALVASATLLGVTVRPAGLVRPSPDTS